MGAVEDANKKFEEEVAKRLAERKKNKQAAAAEIEQPSVEPVDLAKPAQKVATPEPPKRLKKRLFDIDNAVREAVRGK